MEIRLATPADDFSRISRIYAQSWKAGYRGIVPQDYLDTLEETRWVPRLTDGITTSLLLTDGEVYAGTASFCPARDSARAGWGEIVSLYLLPEYWGRGYGGRLLEAAAAALARQGFSELYLWALAENRRARAVYERHGFQLSGDETLCAIGGRDLLEVRYVRRENRALSGEQAAPRSIKTKEIVQ